MQSLHLLPNSLRITLIIAIADDHTHCRTGSSFAEHDPIQINERSTHICTARPILSKTGNLVKRLDNRMPLQHLRDFGCARTEHDRP